LGSVVLGFMHGPTVGLAILGTAIVGLPIVLAFGFRYWPRTAIGRRVLLATPESEQVLPDNPRLRALKALVGQVGRAKGPMLPSGPVVIEGRTVDAVSEGMAIDAGQMVRVVEVHGMEVVVRPIDEGESVAVPSQKAAKDDPLARPIDAIVPDPFDERPPA
jgi:membrane protein implicated in regulation of membrane protease activity